VLAAVLRLGIAAQLVAADISIEIATDSTAVVAASYQIQGQQDSLYLSLAKLRDQRLEFFHPSVVSQRPYIAVSPGLYRIRLAASDAQTVGIRYSVHGDLSRIPFAVPDAPTVSGSTQIHIRVVGVGPNALLRDGFPRLVREADGSAVARLENLPNFLRTPPQMGQWSVNRISETGVVLLALFATACWLLWRRALSRRTTV
jgi:hypothetical protein